MAMWKLKLAIWKLNMALGKLQMAIWKLKMAIRKLKNEHFEAKNGQNWQNAGFGPQNCPKWQPPILSQILYVALVPFFKEGGQTKGGPHKTPPRSDNL